MSLHTQLHTRAYIRAVARATTGEAKRSRIHVPALLLMGIVALSPFCIVALSLFVAFNH